MKKLTTEEYKKIIADELQGLLFQHISKIEEVFAKYIESDIIESYDYEYEDPKVRFHFVLTNGDEFNMVVG